MEKINELPNPADFMKLGENAFIKNVHQKLRETLSPTEKQMWINGYLLALTQQEKSYSEGEVKNAFLDGWQLRDGDLPFPKAKKKWFNEFKKK